MDSGAATRRLRAILGPLRPRPPSTPVPPRAVAADAPLSAHIDALLGALDAQTSCWAEHLPTGRTVAIRERRPMNALSTIKIPILVLAFRDAEAGRIDLEHRHELREGDFRRGSGVLQRFAPGLAPTYRDLLTQMIATSDNTATDLMLAAVGGTSRLNSCMAKLGFGASKMHKCRSTLCRSRGGSCPRLPADPCALAGRPTGELFRRLWVAVDPTCNPHDHCWHLGCIIPRVPA